MPRHLDPQSTSLIEIDGFRLTRVPERVRLQSRLNTTEAIQPVISAMKAVNRP
jgi:hypothetical protein